MSNSIALTDAKAKLSALVKDVASRGVEYVVTVRDKPTVLITPIPKPAPKTLHAKGILSGMVRMATRQEEREAYQQALEDKYAPRY